jgi:hypothetical protein
VYSTPEGGWQLDAPGGHGASPLEGQEALGVAEVQLEDAGIILGAADGDSGDGGRGVGAEARIARVGLGVGAFVGGAGAGAVLAGQQAQGARDAGEPGSLHQG